MEGREREIEKSNLATVTVSTQGRITIPIRVRREMEIDRGTVFDLDISDGQILLKISTRPTSKNRTKEADLLSFNK
jgi:AbrB family looped-hinge helix DNA binding protein